MRKVIGLSRAFRPGTLSHDLDKRRRASSFVLGANHNAADVNSMLAAGHHYSGFAQNGRNVKTLIATWYPTTCWWRRHDVSLAVGWRGGVVVLQRSGD
jgi:hypothetical protein